MGEISPALSNKFANAKIVAALAIVLIHCYLEGDNGTVFWWFTRLVGGGMWSTGGLVRFAVHFFFLASGYFIAGHVDERGWWRRSISARVRTLLIPYVSWLTIACVPAVVINVLEQHSLPDVHWWLASYGMVNERFPILKQFWFLKCLFLLIACSPILVRCAKPIYIMFMLIASAIVVFNPLHLHSSWTWLFGNTFSLEGMTFFTLGIYMRLKGFKLTYMPRALWVSTILFTILSLLAYALFDLHDNSLSQIFRWIAIPFSVVAVWGAIPGRPWPEWLTKSAFPIFLIHFFFVEIMPKRLMIDLGSFGLFVGLFMTWIGSVLLSIIFAWGLRRTQPKLAAILFGWR